MTGPARHRRIRDEPGISASIESAASPEGAGISVRQAEKCCSRLWYVHGIFTPSDGTRHYIAIVRTFCIAAFTATASGGKKFELFIGQFEVLLIGKLHDLIQVFAVSELLLLFIAQLSEDLLQ